MGLTAHKKRGAIFANSHLNDVFSSWRTTNGKLKWVTEPGDPNQIESELPMYVLGMYTGAMRAMLIVKIAEAEAQDDDVEEIKVSPGDVVDFMINRSKEEPLVFVMLIELRYAELTFMLREAEKNGDADLYSTALKYLSPLFAAAHATKYVSMTSDFFIESYSK